MKKRNRLWDETDNIDKMVLLYAVLVKSLNDNYCEISKSVLMKLIYSRYGVVIDSKEMVEKFLRCISEHEINSLYDDYKNIKNKVNDAKFVS